MTQYSIESVLPHAHPMILIDQLETYDEMSATCSLTITAESNFYNVTTQAVPSYVGIEYMAQSIAAYANANEKDQGREVSIGFLVSSRKFRVYTPSYTLGSQLVVNVEQLYKEDSGLCAFDCKINLIKEEQQNILLAEAKINIFQPNDPEAFLAEQK